MVGFLSCTMVLIVEDTESVSVKELKTKLAHVDREDLINEATEMCKSLARRNIIKRHPDTKRYFIDNPILKRKGVL